MRTPRTCLGLGVALALLTLSACAPGPNEMVDTGPDPAGFWLGQGHPGLRIDQCAQPRALGQRQRLFRENDFGRPGVSQLGVHAVLTQQPVLAVLTLLRGALLKAVDHGVRVICPGDIVLAQRSWQAFSTTDQGDHHLVGPWRNGELDSHCGNKIGHRESRVRPKLQHAEGFKIAEHQPLVLVTAQGDQSWPRARRLAQSRHRFEVLHVGRLDEPGAATHGKADRSA